MTTETDKMQLWNAVCKTDPNHTKSTRLKGRQITAISPQYQIMGATQQFGPYGSSWGLKSINYDFSLLDQFKLVMIHAVFFYPGGEFEISNSMSIMLSITKGIIDDDFAKKMETDLLTKALSKIGFNADVFMGLYDDHRYIQQMQNEFHGQPQQQQSQQAAQRVPVINPQQMQQLNGAMMVANVTEAQVCKKYNLKRLGELPATMFETVHSALEKQAIHNQKAQADQQAA